MKFSIKFFLIILGILTGVIALFFFQKKFMLRSGIKPVVVVASITPTLQPLSSTPTKPPVVKLSKSNYSIALFGDSMIDTISDMPELLESQLMKKYPGVKFTVYNYGIGGQTVADGLARWDSPFSNRGRTYQSISTLKLDMIILGSFSFNPFSPHDRERHKNLLTQVVEKAKQTGAHVYMLAEIAPAGTDFGDGPKGVNWGDQQSIEHSNKIIEQIEDVFAIAQSENVTVIDAYNPSKATGSPYAQKRYVNVDDGTHPSPTGHIFTASIIAGTIHFQ